MRIFAIALVSCVLVTQVFAHCTYTGRSGAPGRTTCASSCHGNPGGTVTVSGFPASYTPGQSYLLTVSRVSGDVIENFNSSCRVGTGTTNAGVIAAGTNTSAYNVAGETNGVHLTTCGQASGTFNWTAPAAGTGPVRLYTGAYQGQGFDTGLYTTLMFVSNEAVATPPPAPQNLVIKPVSPYVELDWSPSAGAASYNIYRDVTSGFIPAPANLIGTVAATTFTDMDVIPPPALRFYVVTALTP